MDGEAGAAFFWGFVLGVMIGGLVASTLMNGSWERFTVERGVALYCPTTGYWAMKGDCE